MKYKVSELDGALLDAAVAKAEGMEWEIEPYRVNAGCGITIVRDEPVCVVPTNLSIHFEPSTDWAVGGPIIEREHISLEGRSRNGTAIKEWAARLQPPRLHFGSAPLIAAMRCFVASKLGEEVEL